MVTRRFFSGVSDFTGSSPVENIILNGTFTLANENYVVVYFMCSLGLNPPVQAG